MNSTPKMHPEISEGYEEFWAWDRAYFATHPDQKDYIRTPHPAEISEFQAMDIKNVVAVHVFDHGNGLRSRIPMTPLKTKTKPKGKGFGRV